MISEVQRASNKAYYEANKEKHKLTMKVYREQNREKFQALKKSYCEQNKTTIKRQNKAWELKTKYGLSLEDYNQMLVDQKEKCKACNRHQSEFKIALCVGHCHITGRVRGLLCSSCNKALGLLQENKVTIENLLKYLGD